MLIYASSTKKIKRHFIAAFKIQTRRIGSDFATFRGNIPQHWQEIQLGQEVSTGGHVFVRQQSWQTQHVSVAKQGMGSLGCVDQLCNEEMNAW